MNLLLFQSGKDSAKVHASPCIQMLTHPGSWRWFHSTKASVQYCLSLLKVCQCICNSLFFLRQPNTWISFYANLGKISTPFIHHHWEGFLAYLIVAVFENDSADLLFVVCTKDIYKILMLGQDTFGNILENRHCLENVIYLFLSAFNAWHKNTSLETKPCIVDLGRIIVLDVLPLPFSHSISKLSNPRTHLAYDTQLLNLIQVFVLRGTVLRYMWVIWVL